MKSSLTWPKQGWMRDGLCSELTIALPRTEGSDSGFWRTPMVADGSHNHCLAPSVLEGRTTVVLTNQVKMVEAGMWPTPDTQNHRDGSKLRKDNNLAQGGRHGVSLHHAVWMGPTPTQDMVTNRIKRYAQGGLPLTTAVSMWPTPTTQDNPQVRGDGKATGNKRGTTLGGAVRKWPTPRASEWKGVGPIGSKSHQHRLDRKYLDATVQEAEQRTGHLNPTWVEWLMGWPIGWTDLKPLETDRFHEWLQQHGFS